MSRRLFEEIATAAFGRLAMTSLTTDH